MVLSKERLLCSRSGNGVLVHTGTYGRDVCRAIACNCRKVVLVRCRNPIFIWNNLVVQGAVKCKVCVKVLVSDHDLLKVARQPHVVFGRSCRLLVQTPIQGMIVWNRTRNPPDELLDCSLARPHVYNFERLLKLYWRCCVGAAFLHVRRICVVILRKRVRSYHEQVKPNVQKIAHHGTKGELRLRDVVVFQRVPRFFQGIGIGWAVFKACKHWNTQHIVQLLSSDCRKPLSIGTLRMAAQRTMNQDPRSPNRRPRYPNESAE